MQKCTINCHHNTYLESIKMSIIGENWGNAKKHHEHNRLKPILDINFCIHSLLQNLAEFYTFSYVGT